MAAGESTRMGEGRVKQLLPFHGEPLVRRAARTALASHLNELIVVVGCAGDAVREALAGLDVRIVDNPDYRAGQSTSVKAGLSAVDPAADAVLFIPVDHPFLAASVINQLISVFAETDGPIVVPAYRGQPGAPVLLDRSLFPELAEITGDEGGRQLFEQHSDEIVTVPLTDERPLLDVDTPDDYQVLLEMEHAS